MQVGILHGKVELDHPERNPARHEANSGRGVAELVSIPEEPYEGNPHVRFCEGGSRSYDLYPSTRQSRFGFPNASSGKERKRKERMNEILKYF